MSEPIKPRRPRAFDSCPRSRSNDPTIVAVEFTYSAACEILEFLGFVAAAHALALQASQPGQVDSVAAEARGWARKGGALAAREWRDRQLRGIADLGTGDPQ